ncbi:hypothetical protein [Egicoccus sp. AB-alg2]|uniref:hypothetical protein n=1 Tax=Egicoccus sp. AB-alg2 TaxID=3242693 RepID=UPI00359E227F
MGVSRVRLDADVFTSDGQLARSDEQDLSEALQHLDGLLRAANALLAASGHAPGVVDCRAAGCLLAGVADGPALCRLAHRLIGDRPDPATTSPVLGAAVAHFRAALPLAMDAVRACRQTAHPNGACWFSPNHRADACGAVLRLAHELC